VLIETELLLALLLLFGLFQRTAWATCVLFFGVASTFSLYRGLAGETSCGCFGTLTVNPWVTLSLDLTAFVVLTFTRPSPIVHSALPFGRLAVASVTVVVASVLLVPEQPVMLSAEMTLHHEDQVVVLKPDEWIGKSFPLLEDVGIGDRLTEGEWLVLFYHTGCPKCEEAVHRLRLQHWRTTTQSIALVEVPPLQQAYRDDPRFAGIVLGALDERHHWLVHTPVALALREGLVVAVDHRIGERDLDDALSNN
jgi:hypothetical protein